MPNKQDNEPTYAKVMQQIIDSIDVPIPVKEFSEQVLALRPPKAKNPLQAIWTQILVMENPHQI